jgi:hypothetical protein
MELPQALATFQAPEQRFCVALEAGAGWETSVGSEERGDGRSCFCAN